MVHAILFDMDGVIVDSMRSHAGAWKQVLGDYGMVLDDIDILKREGMSGRQSVEDIFIERGRPVPDEDEFRLLLQKKNALFERDRISLFPQVVTMLSWIKKRNKPTALVTGSLRRSVAHVMPGGVLSLFDVLITAEDVTNGKPDPEPYVKACMRLGVEPDRALIIENAPMGIRSAKSAGALCYALETTMPGRLLADADRIFRDHESLFEFLKSHLD
ncbi:MAG: hypothetical protein A2176_13490 [Spirochaetes bacterium RBG_13_51_14]|nr:MAG: hypothetical protein A2176_13490 [Spirochaetes bacterium RBG_13_51_14]